MIDVEELARIACLTDDPDDYDDAAYALCLHDANYPVPALLVDIDYWPATATMDGQPALYCFDHHKPGMWREWLKIGGDNF